MEGGSGESIGERVEARARRARPAPPEETRRLIDGPRTTPPGFLLAPAGHAPASRLAPATFGPRPRLTIGSRDWRATPPPAFRLVSAGGRPRPRRPIGPGGRAATPTPSDWPRRGSGHAPPGGRRGDGRAGPVPPSLPPSGRAERRGSSARTGTFPPLAGGRARTPRRTVHQRLSSWPKLRVVYCSTVLPSDDVTVVYQNGLPVISVRLPSRRERCQFTLKPISDSVGVFLRQLQEEDRGIDRVAIYSQDGARVASSTGIDLLLLDDFKLVINDLSYQVRPPKRELLSHESAASLNDVKTLVQQLYTTLCIDQHQLSKEKELLERLEELKEQLAPLEKVRLEISRKAEKRTTLVLWGGLAYMATQFGILARLTWWEYSWDIMEPVTYFITYGSAMAMYAYFVMTRQEYIYPEARDRQYLLFFHKGAKKTRFDLEKYNQLKDAIAQTELDLKRLRDPLQVHLPLRRIGDKD
ncbi:calcium uniporter protein, mitochondrial [Tachyglossus aculeatus]|uniref:calcium uniporter protein, mitochondrial n=1 Tax=Tachyglossus aculeatus TaxID=9261 RepID=UPI0018F41C2A|nr:calcium uniporter protein, mitochondrial [Tachyglossus aculeatus]